MPVLPPHLPRVPPANHHNRLPAAIAAALPQARHLRTTDTSTERQVHSASAYHPLAAPSRRPCRCLSMAWLREQRQAQQHPRLCPTGSRAWMMHRMAVPRKQPSQPMPHPVRGRQHLPLLQSRSRSGWVNTEAGTCGPWHPRGNSCSSRGRSSVDSFPDSSYSGGRMEWIWVWVWEQHPGGGGGTM